MTQNERRERINEIHQRLREYYKHCNDKHACFQDEIPAVKKLKDHALFDIKFLINELNEVADS